MDQVKNPKNAASLNTKRDSYWDNLKAILIFFVVLGHFLLPVAEKKNAVFACYWWIYSFHMPAFVFSSGYFAKGYIKKKENRADRLSGYMAVYVVFTVLLWLFQLVFIHRMKWREFLAPSATPWYLLAMFFWHLLLPYIVRFPKLLALIGALAVSLLAGAYTECGNFLAISRVIVFLPFFLAGYYFDGNRRLLEKPYVRIASALILLAAFALLSRYEKLFEPYLTIAHGNESYYAMNMSVREGLVARIAWYCVAVVMAASIMSIVPSKRNKASYIGSRTLGIYVLHRLCREAFKGLGAYRHLGGNSILTLLLCILISCAITWVFSTEKVHALFESIYHLKFLSIGKKTK